MLIFDGASNRGKMEMIANALKINIEGMTDYDAMCEISEWWAVNVKVGQSPDWLLELSKNIRRPTKHS